MTKEEREKIIEAAQQDPILMPDGGHCCLRMTDSCYGCACYSLGAIGRCHDRIQTYWENYESRRTKKTF